ncbi:MAG TPA: Tex family protein [Candidatus Kapabacteria bacterium]|nr:Tex family protein [Candidatus Kapabacteria bacterium]
MLDIVQLIAGELSLQPANVRSALDLFAEGGTIPFIARYRKERTGEMNEIELRALHERHTYLTELAERKRAILESIAEQGKLTDELRRKIEECLQKTELEDLYLPYKPKRRTRATIARERGLEPLAGYIRSQNTPEGSAGLLDAEAAKYVNAEMEVPTAADALAGAADILAEEISEKADIRAALRDYMLQEGMFTSRVKPEFPEGTTKFEMYRDYRVRVKEIQPHNMLALRRGENDGVLFFEVLYDHDHVMNYLESREIRARDPRLREFLRAMLADCFDRLLKFSLIGEIRVEKKRQADVESIRTFEENLRELLLSSPAGMKPTLGVDPGFRTGCKVAALDHTGKFLEYQAIFPHASAGERERAARTLVAMIQRHGIELVAIGNGTAGRETEQFVTETLAGLEKQPVKVMVNESGASIYSASEVAIEEFPDLDITVRGAISIARRLQDPLAELVKIDPKSIGVGQYQHDVDQRLLKKKLEETVESCVNYVGVDLNTASKELLGYVAGITPSVAKSIIAHRNQHGAFLSRHELLKVAKFGPKTFEQAAGFLRIRDGANPLDNTAVHPERYDLVERIAADLSIPASQVTRQPERLKALDLRRYVSDTVGEPTLRDILSELEKPGRDPRAEFRYATFKEGIREIKDLRTGMELEGVVTNVANFGAFVDIGVHQDGLVHISQLADHYVNDPKTVVKVGQVVRVRVLEVNEGLKRIGLSMKSDGGAPRPNRRASAQAAAPPKREFTLDDLKAKFNNK